MAEETGPLNVALVQICAGLSPERNLHVTSALIRRAAADGARLIATPEVTNLMQRRPWATPDAYFDEATDPSLAAFRELAASLSVWLHIGSLALRRQGRHPDRVSDGNTAPDLVNRGFLIDARGAIRARYDKIHLFDADPGSGPNPDHGAGMTAETSAVGRSRESRHFQPGDRAVLAPTPWGPYGLSICYDLRFPHLYRHLAQAGALMLSVPSAFTVPTGRAHWHVLLRARAIEAGAFVFAAAQCGTHEDGRSTFGHSLIIDPWGRVLADGGSTPGIISAVIDPSAALDARGMIPSLQHDRPYTLSIRGQETIPENS